jgi:hypothetical protein
MYVPYCNVGVVTLNSEIVGLGPEVVGLAPGHEITAD